MFITVTASAGQLANQKIDIVVDKVFGVMYNETLKTSVIVSDAGSSIPVKESLADLKQMIKEIKDGNYVIETEEK